jgi:hypothetical protein
MKIEKKLKTKRTPWAKDNHPQMEIKIDTGMGTQSLVIVAVDGWNHKDQSREARNPTPTPWNQNRGVPVPNSIGMQVRLSMNGPLMLTMTEWKYLNRVIDESYQEVLDEYVIRGL